MKKYRPPLGITIPLPYHITRGIGTSATSGRGGNLRVRCTDKEYDLVMSEAKRLGLPLANFSRFIIVHVAEQLKRHREEGLDDFIITEE